MAPEDIDFDNPEKVKESSCETVEIPVGVLAILLDSYYTGGGEPSSNNARLVEAYDLWIS